MEHADASIPKSFWKSRVFIVSAAILGLLLLYSAWFFLLRTPPLIISTKTTRITGPLTADGRIDFLKAIEDRVTPPELATDDNGYRDFVRNFGDDSSRRVPANREFYRKQLYEKLGLDPNVPPTLTLPQEPQSVLLSHFTKTKVDDPYTEADNAIGKPWTLDGLPMLADWLKETEAPLDAVAEAVRKPVFFTPLLRSPDPKSEDLIAAILPEIQEYRSLARCFSARAMYRIGSGNIDGAIDDKLASYRLGRHIAHRGSMIQLLVGISIEGMAAALPVGANPEHPLTEKQIQRLLDGLDTLPSRSSLGDVYEWERFYGLSGIQGIYHDKLSFATLADLAGSQKFFALAVFSCNWNIVFRRANELYDSLSTPESRAKYLAARGALPTFWENATRMLTPEGRGNIVADILMETLASPSRFEEVIHRVECVGNMQRLSLAILSYRLEHGNMPDENWATQIVKYLGTNPQRYFSCPANPSPEGETTYAMILYGNELPVDPDTLLLVELLDPVPLGKAVVSVDDVLDRQGTGSKHSGGMIAGYRSGAVRVLGTKDELAPLLGRKIVEK